MKILASDKKKNLVRVQLENLNDLWVLYNTLQPGDQLEGKTTRRVVVREGDKGERKPMHLGITVESVEFHEASRLEESRLRVKGKIYKGPQDWVSIGSHHTFNLEPGHVVTIVKGRWSKFQLSRVMKASRPVAETRMIIVPIDKGDALVAVITNYSTSVTATIHHNIPGKRYEKFDRKMVEGLMRDFYDDVLNAVREQAARGPVDLLILTGPGFIKERFLKVLKKAEPELGAKARLVNASSASESAIQEVLKDEATVDMAKEQRVVVESRLMDEFIRRIGKAEGTATYGAKEVRKAVEAGAVEKLLVSDQLLREVDEKKRGELDRLFRDTEMGGGEIWVVSSLHPAGEQLVDFGGLVALLRYKLGYT
ncbi:MAG: mRNA surveillance protein pelota [Promethearchaeota archaeon]